MKERIYFSVSRITILLTLLTLASCNYVEEELQEIFQIKQIYINQAKKFNESGFLIQNNFPYFNIAPYLNGYFIFTNNIESKYNANLSMLMPGNIKDLTFYAENNGYIVNIIHFNHFFGMNKYRYTNERLISYSKMYYLSMWHMVKVHDFPHPYKLFILKGYLNHPYLATKSKTDSLDYLKSTHNRYERVIFHIESIDVYESTIPYIPDTKINLEDEQSSPINFFNEIILEKELRNIYNIENKVLKSNVETALNINTKCIQSDCIKYAAIYLIIKSENNDQLIILRPEADYNIAYYISDEKSNTTINPYFPFHDYGNLNLQEFIKKVNSYIIPQNTYDKTKLNEMAHWRYSRFFLY